MRRLPQVLLAVLVVSLTSVVASEGKAAGSAAATAKACFKRGWTHYQLGEYREAT